MEMELNKLFTNDEKTIIKDSLADDKKQKNSMLIRIVLVVTVIILLFVGMGRRGYLSLLDISSSFTFFMLLSLIMIIPISRKQSMVIKKLYNELERINGEDSAEIYLEDGANSRGKQDRSGKVIAVGVLVGILLLLVAAFFLQLDYFGTEEMCTENFMRNMRW